MQDKTVQPPASKLITEKNLRKQLDALENLLQTGALKFADLDTYWLHYSNMLQSYPDLNTRYRLLQHSAIALLAEGVIGMNQYLAGKITPHELVNIQHHDDAQVCPNIANEREFTSQLDTWVRQQIVLCDSGTERILRFERMVWLADYCYNSRDFHAVNTIVSALDSQPLQRLQQTKNSLSLSARERLNELSELTNASASQVRIRNKEVNCLLPITVFIDALSDDAIGSQIDLSDLGASKQVLEAYESMKTLQTRASAPPLRMQVPMHEILEQEQGSIPNSEQQACSIICEPYQSSRERLIFSSPFEATDKKVPRTRLGRWLVKRREQKQATAVSHYRNKKVVAEALDACQESLVHGTLDVRDLVKLIADPQAHKRIKKTKALRRQVAMLMKQYTEMTAADLMQHHKLLFQRDLTDELLATDNYSKPHRRPLTVALEKDFRQLGLYFKNLLLSQHDLAARTLLLEMTVQLIETCREKGDYQAMMAIYSGITAMEVRHLVSTHQGLSKASQAVMAQMELLTSPIGANRNIRSAMLADSISREVVPYLGVIQTYLLGKAEHMKNAMSDELEEMDAGASALALRQKLEPLDEVGKYLKLATVRSNKAGKPHLSVQQAAIAATAANGFDTPYLTQANSMNEDPGPASKVYTALQLHKVTPSTLSRERKDELMSITHAMERLDSRLPPARKSTSSPEIELSSIFLTASEVPKKNALKSSPEKALFERVISNASQTEMLTDHFVQELEEKVEEKRSPDKRVVMALVKDAQVVQVKAEEEVKLLRSVIKSCPPAAIKTDLELQQLVTHSKQLIDAIQTHVLTILQIFQSLKEQPESIEIFAKTVEDETIEIYSGFDLQAGVTAFFKAVLDGKYNASTEFQLKGVRDDAQVIYARVAEACRAKSIKIPDVYYGSEKEMLLQLDSTPRPRRTFRMG